MIFMMMTTMMMMIKDGEWDDEDSVDDDMENENEGRNNLPLGAKGLLAELPALPSQHCWIT